MLNILVVDDDRYLALTLADGLRKELEDAIHVNVCLNGPDALAMCSENTFDLVISDFNMPGMTGIELFKQIRMVRPQTILILITAYGTSELENEAPLFSYTYITKPFELTILSRFIHQLIISSEEVAKVHRFLLLEDDFTLRRLISKVLQNGGIEVFETSSLKEARTYLETSRFDGLIADNQVDDGNGIDLIREYRELLTRNGTIVILATGESRYRYLEEELGIALYLEKPFAVQDLAIMAQRFTFNKKGSPLEKSHEE